MIGAVFSWRDLGIALALIARGLAARLPDPEATTMGAFAAWFLGCAALAAIRSGAIDAKREDQPSSSARS
jgi:hypothetical protein